MPDPRAPGAAEPQPQREEETGVPQLAATDVSVQSLPRQMLRSSRLPATSHHSRHTFLSAPCISFPLVSLCLSLATWISASISPFRAYRSLCVFQSPSLCPCPHVPLSVFALSISVSFSFSHYLSLALSVSLRLFLPLSLSSLLSFSPFLISVSPQACEERTRSGPRKGIGVGGGQSCYWEISWLERPVPARVGSWGKGVSV